MQQNVKVLVVSLILLIIVAVVAFNLLKDDPSNARVILDHTHKTYIAPSCFEESDPTNFIEESTLGEAEELGYPPHSACTEEALGAQ
ncbi:hypothetical protein [Bhargavaea cecembensis]|uniref:hypothetical protein n=1 Tax=Bhargavaea cecembensis TaxID=394098 RepID=UPI0009ED464D|nr:hypothetical protein [Bhargavaea cecembensis]